MKNDSVKKVVATGIGAALFFVLARFVAIPSGIPNTTITFQYAAQAVFAVLYGPVVGCLSGFIGHVLTDMSWGGVWWSWAFATAVYGLEDDFLEQNVGMMKKEADEKGSINFYDIFHKQTTVFPAEFVYDLLDQRIKGFKDFPGNILIVHGDNDITVDVKESISLYNDLDKCSEKKLEILEKADHGFGLWDGRISDNEKLIEHSFSFLKEYL